MSRLIHRVTMFKLPGADKQAQLLAAYDTLAKEQNKVIPPFPFPFFSFPYFSQHSSHVFKQY